MRDKLGWFATRWGFVILAVLGGAALSLFIASLLIGRSLDNAPDNAPAVITSEGRYQLKPSPEQCPAVTSTCTNVTVPAGDTIKIENLVAALGITALQGTAPTSVKRTVDGWEIILAPEPAVLLLSAAGDVWVITAS